MLRLAVVSLWRCLVGKSWRVERQLRLQRSVAWRHRTSPRYWVRCTAWMMVWTGVVLECGTVGAAAVAAVDVRASWWESREMVGWLPVSQSGQKGRRTLPGSSGVVRVFAKLPAKLPAAVGAAVAAGPCEWFLGSWAVPLSQGPSVKVGSRLLKEPVVGALTVVVLYVSSRRLAPPVVLTQ